MLQQFSKKRKSSQQRVLFPYIFSFSGFNLGSLKWKGAPRTPSLCMPNWDKGGGQGFRRGQSQSPKGFVIVVCGGQSLKRAKRRSQSGISGCGHGWRVIPHSRHVSKPNGRTRRDHRQFTMSALHLIVPLPCVDEVLSQADVGGGPCDGNLALRWPFHGISNFDLRPRHLTDLVDFGALASDYAAY